MSAEPRIGLFLGQDNHLLATRLDFERLEKIAVACLQVRIFQEVEQIFTPEAVARIKKTLAEHDLDGIVLTGFHLTQAAPRLAAAGLDLEAVELVEWRDLLQGDQQNRKWVNQKAEAALRKAIARLINKDRLQLQEVKISQTVLVIGHGWIALHAAFSLASLGLKVLLVCSQTELGDKRDAGGYTRETAAQLDQLLAAVDHHPGIEIRLGSRIVEFAGGAGQYRALVQDDAGRQQPYQVGGVVLALEPELVVDFTAWGLTPSERVMSLCDLEALDQSEDSNQPLQALAAPEPAQAVFLLGFTHNSSPVSQHRAFRAALKLVEGQGLRVLVLLDHFKVAEAGLEDLSQRARQAAVVFVKVTGSPPVIEKTDDSLVVRFFDEVMNQEQVVKPQLIVLEEARRPPPEALGIPRACYTCSTCSSRCPVAGVYGLDPRQAVRMIAYGLDQELIDSRFPWICTLCGRCESACPMNVPLVKILRTVRGLRERDKVPGPIHKGVIMDLERGNNLGIPQEDFLFLLNNLGYELKDEGYPGFYVPIDQEGANFLVTINSKEPFAEPDDLKFWWKIFYAAKESWTVPAVHWEGVNWALFSGDDESMQELVGRIVANMQRLIAVL